jgi:undecaprenyl-diphosphatase
MLEVLRTDDTLIALVIAGTTIGFGLLLWYADVRGSRRMDEYAINWIAALIIGLFQAIAIIPGTSRSGITMTAGLFIGLTRHAASRFSFLLAIPTILLAGAIATKDLLEATAAVDWAALGIGALLSFVVAYLTIHLFLRFIERVSMLPFVLYRLLLGGAILWLVLM